MDKSKTRGGSAESVSSNDEDDITQMLKEGNMNDKELAAIKK